MESSFGISSAPWHVATAKSPISGEDTIEEYSRQLGNVLTLPEMLYGGSYVELRHASGWAIRFDAINALVEWRQEDLPPLQVTVAKAWQQARQEEISRQEAAVLQYDWTYTTPYGGTLLCQQASQHPAAGSNSGGSVQQRQEQPAARTAAPHAQLASSSPPSAATAAANEGQGVAANGGSGNGSPAAGIGPGWQPTTEQLDRSLLLARDPILFYADVPLYESELDDNGVCALGVRLRVMPRCWFAMLRFWLRVDHTLVRLRETRLMCRYDDPAMANVVLRETKHMEGTYEELRAAGAPMGRRVYEDADAAAGVFSAIAPACVCLYQLDKLELPPAGSS